MPEVRWKSFAEVSSEREYLALISHLRLKRSRTIPRFLGFSREIETQLRESKGWSDTRSGRTCLAGDF